MQTMREKKLLRVISAFCFLLRGSEVVLSDVAAGGGQGAVGGEEECAQTGGNQLMCVRNSLIRPTNVIFI